MPLVRVVGRGTLGDGSLVLQHNSFRELCKLGSLPHYLHRFTTYATLSTRNAHSLFAGACQPRRRDAVRHGRPTRAELPRLHEGEEQEILRQIRRQL